MLYFIISPQRGLVVYSLSVTMHQLMQELKLQELVCIPVPYYPLQPCKTRPKASQTHIYIASAILAKSHCKTKELSRYKACKSDYRPYW